MELLDFDPQKILPRPYEPGAPFHAPPFPPHFRPHARRGGAVKRNPRKTTKVVQSAYCEVCKVDCTSQEDLNSHKKGRRHKRNLQKLQDSITWKPPTAPAPDPAAATPAADAAKEPAPAPAIATKGKAIVAGEKQKKRKEAGPAKEEDLETKKRKVLEGGATPDGVRVCMICNVVVNSPKVFELHISGQKHIAMVKLQQEQAPAAPAAAPVAAS